MPASPGKGLIKRVARETGRPVSAVKSELMRNVAAAAKMILPNVASKYGVQADTKLAWIPALAEAAKIAFEYLRSHGRIPTAADIVDRYRGGRAVAAAATQAAKA